MNVGIIGAGITGLSLGYHLSKEHEVTLFERDDRLGGQATYCTQEGFEFDKYYHFIFLNDYHTIGLAKELGIGHKIRWGRPAMALSIGHNVYPFSTAMDLLRFPIFGWWDKLRFGLATGLIGRLTTWEPLERENGLAWFEKMYGKNVTTTLWKPLMETKFREFCPKVNAAWSWNEIHRRSKSRRGLGKEKLGYFEGGMNTLLSSLSDHIDAHGGTIITRSRLRRIRKEKGKIAVTSSNGKLSFDAVFSTIPLKVLNSYLPRGNNQQRDDVEYLSVRCAVFLMKRPLSKYFWINVLEKNLPHTVVVESTNLSNTYPHIVYIPFYYPFGGKYFTLPENSFKKLNYDLMRKINPGIKKSDILHYRSFGDPYVQAVFDTDYSKKISTYHTIFKGLYNTNHSYIYPERSGVNECVRFGKYLARDFSKGLDKTYVFTSE